MTSERPLDTLRTLHEDVDKKARELSARHAARMRCAKGCCDCCVDGLTVFEIEAERIRRRHPTLLGEGKPHLPGRCAFLDPGGACRIYDDRPYVCRTQGLPLRWIGEDGDGREAEFRDICPLNEPGGPPPEALMAAECWTIGPVEERLATAQASFEGAPAIGPGLRRIALRTLFD